MLATARPKPTFILSAPSTPDNATLEKETCFDSNDSRNSTMNAGGTVDFEGRKLTKSNLRASVADGATFGVMVGAGESYFAAFALAVGLGEVSAGLVSSVPLLAGGILQLISLRAVKWIGSEKRWIVLCSAMQGLAFIPLVIAAVTGSVSLGGLLVIASVYWAGGLAGGPAWNTWIEVIVPRKIRPRYFARRTRISQFMTLIGLVGGGALLQWAEASGQTLAGFACLFAIAGLFRMWSVYWLARHQTPGIIGPNVIGTGVIGTSAIGTNANGTSARRSRTDRAPKSDAARNAGNGMAVSGVRLLAYLVVVQGMVQVSGPYFASYMLEQLQYSYASFVTLLAVGFLAKVAALTAWVTVAHRGGAKMLLWIGGVGIVPLASLWIVSQNFYWLMAVQILSGTMWAAYELGFFLLFFEALPIERRTRMLTYYNLANTSAWCAGALIGAWLLKSNGVGETGYYVLFGVSSLGRLAALSLLFGANFNSVPVLRVCMRIIGVGPASATLDSPILPTLEESERSAAPVEPLAATAAA